MNRTAHSEVGRLDRVMLNPAQAAFQSQLKLDKEWSDLNFLSVPQFEKAKKEYASFAGHIGESAITYFESGHQLSLDAIYCRDASIATNQGMIICRMGKANREPEPTAHAAFYERHGIQILGQIEPPGTLEGGDVAWIDEHTLAVGHTYRTNHEGIEQLRQLLEPLGVDVIVAEMPHYKGPSDVFHLMSVFSPIDHDLAVVYSPLMPIHFRNFLKDRGYSFVEVPDEEFDSMGCNVLALAPRKCLMVAGNPITKQRLQDAGCEVSEYEGNEISVKGGGGPTCLTRPIWRIG